MSNNMGLSFVVVTQIIGPKCLYCLLSSLRVIFKVYKDLTHFSFFFHMY